jgi:hypothetical protein
MSVIFEMTQKSLGREKEESNRGWLVVEDKVAQRECPSY